MATDTTTDGPAAAHVAAAEQSPRGAKKRFLHDAAESVRDVDHRAFVRKALGGYYTNRDAQKARYGNWETARDAASLAKWSAVNRLDELLPRFADNFTANGGQVHWARDAEEAREIILGLVRAAKAKAIIKSKCMTSEEVHLNAALEQEGYGVVESDLGEFIQQLRGEPPYHFVFPCMHVRRGEISDLFSKHLGTAATDSPEELTMIARRHMRQLYVDADVGITGANFLVAETGQISITENEGNARLTAALPRVHIALAGIEKVVEHLDDLAVLLPILATAGAGQRPAADRRRRSVPARPFRGAECDQSAAAGGPVEPHPAPGRHLSRWLEACERQHIDGGSDQGRGIPPDRPVFGARRGDSRDHHDGAGCRPVPGQQPETGRNPRRKDRGDHQRAKGGRGDGRPAGPVAHPAGGRWLWSE